MSGRPLRTCRPLRWTGLLLALGPRRQLVLATMLLAATLLALPLRASESIGSYDTVIDVRADGTLQVTESITVRAEGDRIRRGIYRDFPTRYRDRRGNRVVVDLQVLSLQRNGSPEPWFTESRANGVRINFGNDDLLPVPAEYTYVLRYRTTRQLGFFDRHDELYWNAVGTGWEFPVEQATVRARLPAPIPADAMALEAYTGAAGTQGDGAYIAALVAPGEAFWRTTSTLAPREGFTVVLGFPKGVVAAPGHAQRAAWLLQDNRGILVALAGLLALLAYCVTRWRRVGRDPRAGTVIARYEPPAGHSPAGLRYVREMGYDARCFSVDLLALAVGGHVRIHRDKSLLQDKWRLERLQPRPDIAPDRGAQVLLDTLFKDAAGTLDLHHSQAAIVAAAHAAHQKILSTRYVPAMFNRHGGSIGIAALIAAAAGVLAVVTSGGAGIAVIAGLVALMLLMVIAFALLVRAHTPSGRALLDEVEGLKLYLGVAEREELERLQGPGGPPALDAARYEALLPYAVALEVEDAWTRRFTAAVGDAAAAAATSGIGWYRGAGAGDLAALSRAVGSSLSTQISS
ncbi:MAG: DUF2207 domain-containing protein, partial [Pseudomonadota bacterium]|nr:DUF2207 domain-containing protein [Pseudomonadota bacterium]